MSGNFITKEQFDALYQNCLDFVFFMKKVNNEFQYVYINHEAEDVFDESPIGKNLSACLEKEIVELIVRNYNASIEKQKPLKYRDFYLFSDTKRTSETMVTPISFGGEQYILAVTKKISRQKVMEEKNLFLQSLFDMKMDPTILLASDLTFFDGNPKFQQFFNCKIEDWKGRPFFDFPLVALEDLESFGEHLRNALNGKGQPPVLFKHKKADGNESKFLVSFSPISTNNQVAAIYIQWIELTKNVQLKEDLRKMNHVLSSYKGALNSAANICITDKDGIIEYVNERYAQTSQYSAEELVGNKTSILNSRTHSSSFYEEMWKRLLDGQIWRGEICNRSKYGSRYWVDTTIVPIFNSRGEIENFLSVCFDVSEKKIMMTNLRNIEKTFRLITENTNDLIVITNEDGIVLYVSPNHEKCLGFDKEELLGRFYFDMMADRSRELLKSEFELTLLQEGEVQIELQIKAKDGSTFWIETYITAVKDAERDEVYQFVTVAREITQRKKMEDQLRFMAYHDSLTMLPNRRYLLMEFSKLVKEAIVSENSIALLYIDGDKFKKVNDNFGHDVGDEFIRNFGVALDSSVRDLDIVSRIGGDEFIVILTNMSSEKNIRKQQIENTIERIQQTLKNGWTINDHHFSPTSSIGISCFPEQGQSIDDLLEKADEALYFAKKTKGKNSYHFSR
ncbi:PAS domain S-box protein [Viridibacillus sp. YIM B01967]|uniref:PAS domain S-box protein n=1 Tax=Viridibacillus soli TaxID=2798301 RepID=A0ABS1HBT6_9BACL|nr:PAS domain S-box protein [Viridibacillus soli]MBK3496845.1 PAS domain S-box protein [Viridibacillus soli]